MRAAKPQELTERALPVMTATISQAELEEWLPFRFQEITDPLAAAEPSRGALLQLESGQYFVVYWGHDSGQLTVRIPEEVEPSFFLASFLNEVPLRRAQITWIRDGVRLPVPTSAARKST
jgi:hypothetical protein